MLLVILSVSTVSSTAFGQGIVNFANSPSTLVSYSVDYPSPWGLIYGTDTFYFALLTSVSGAAGTFFFTGIYATNSAIAPGRFVNNGVAVPNWQPGTSRFFQVAGWSSSLGATFNPGWLVAPPGGMFGLSAVGYGAAGGPDYWTPAIPAPPLQIFGPTGIKSGFTLCCAPVLQWGIQRGNYPLAGVRFYIVGVPGIPVIIEASTNLAAPFAWMPLQNLTLTNGGIFFYDSDWTNYPRRFYRVRSPEP
jgi:hypothetical protein